jgi:Carboxypeptidase regulatory-like domain
VVNKVSTLTLLISCALAAPLRAQSRTGELRLKVVDPTGLGIKSTVELVSESNEFKRTFVTDNDGRAVAERLPFGRYALHIQRPGFAPLGDSVEVRSALPISFVAHLSIATVHSSVVVNDEQTLVNSDNPAESDRVGRETIDTRTRSLPGRSLQDMVN